MQPGTVLLGELIALQRAQDGPEKVDAEELGIGSTAFLAKPDEDLGRRGALAEPAIPEGTGNYSLPAGQSAPLRRPLCQRILPP